MKTQISTSVSGKTRQQADKLTQVYGTLRDTVTIAIFSLYEKEFNTMPSNGSQMLTALVEKAMERMSAEGIEGWGLINPDPALFDLSEIAETHGCTSRTCQHHSHNPASPTYKVLPRAGRLVFLGDEIEVDEVSIGYYALVLADEAKFFRLTTPHHYWAALHEIDPGDVPDWALAYLAK